MNKKVDCKKSKQQKSTIEKKLQANLYPEMIFDL